MVFPVNLLISAGLIGTGGCFREMIGTGGYRSVPIDRYRYKHWYEIPVHDCNVTGAAFVCYLSICTLLRLSLLRPQQSTLILSTFNGYLYPPLGGENFRTGEEPPKF